MRFGFASILFFLLFVTVTNTVAAHPGRTDANGGHTCRTNCEKWGLQYGEYHYHNGGSTSGGSNVAQPIYPTATPVAQQVIAATIAPTKKPTPTPYVETDMDKKKLFKVVEVVDGDTIKISIRGKVETVRLLGIDTPETKDPRKPVQCFGMEATKKMQSFVNGKFVKLIDDRTQGNRDKYGRLLRYVYLDDKKKTFVNGEMIAQGYAFSYKQYPTKYLEKFNRFEQQAREKNRGLWKACQ